MNDASKTSEGAVGLWFIDLASFQMIRRSVCIHHVLISQALVLLIFDAVCAGYLRM